MTKTAKIAVVILIIAVIVAVVIYIHATQPPNSSPTPTATPTPTHISPSPTPLSTVQSPAPSSEESKQEQIRDSVMGYIKTNHPETAQFMNDLIWTGGRATSENIVGSEKYMYYTGGWNFTMSYPVVPQPIYTITADYKAPDVGIPYRIIWAGTWQNQVINETNYVFAQ